MKDGQKGDPRRRSRGDKASLACPQRDPKDHHVHSNRLASDAGAYAKGLKTVEGAAELRHMLAKRQEQNRDARVTGS
ncbi:hypothetical protein [Gymnodinialimonas ulvae]|uniref:hypothetical protein n=1 Tax=Gymnodinialimonas ulvae TaxID=3126504 RepID=UPI0030EE615C